MSRDLMRGAKCFLASVKGGQSRGENMGSGISIEFPKFEKCLMDLTFIKMVK